MIRSLVAATAAILVACTLLPAPPAAAGVEVYRDGARYVEIGGRIQLQYHAFEPDAGDSQDELFFRRLRPYLQGSVTEDWFAKIQFDVGGASGSNELAVKDAYFRYTGFDAVEVTVGNQKPPFSREFLTSSKEQQLVERTFVGDHNYGSPDRMLGVKVDGEALGEKLVWSGSFGGAAIDPDAGKLDFDTPVNRDDDFNEGWLTAGRVELHPFGFAESSQGDLGHGPLRLTLAAAAFTWSNDGDNDTYTAGGVSTSAGKADVDEATGFELSAGVRGLGFSADAQYDLVEADTVDAGFDGGLWLDGSTELEQLALEGGYMVLPNRLELVGGWQSQDADGYADTWTRTSFGINYFVDGYKLKGQLTWRMGENLDGVPANDADELFLQLQYVF
jgi:phosphate-selective porin OprO and OprP